ncbi:MAG: FAD-dependent oxidoreductase [Clostridia bacterium]|nr:FAD-dependent oxidoreductase [Clostridia bacterium]
MRYLIVGNGAAGITAAEKLRELSLEDEITIISNEDTPVYTKCMLPDYIGEKLPREKLLIRNLESYNKNNINLVLDEKIAGFDLNNKKVILSSGGIKEYDKLLLAMGGTPFIPYIEGLADVGYFTLNSIKDADAIKQKAAKGGRAIIIGAGLTGIEVGFALKRLGMEVAIIEREKRILPLQLDEQSSCMLVEKMQNEGISLLLGAADYKIAKDDNNSVNLSSGLTLHFDLLVLTIGTRPNIELLKNTDIKYGRGVLVDEYMCTSVKDVYAAGDVAEMTNKLSTEYVSSYIWPNAMAQGKCAAFNMAGQFQEFSYAAAMQNSVQLRDIPFVSAGMINPKGTDFEALVDCDTEKGVYKKVVLKDNIVKGMIMIGDTSSANLIGALMRKSIDVSPFKHNMLEKGFTLPK